MEKLSQLLSERVLLSDGSMGALLASKGYAVPCPDELASTEPQVIKNIHRAYLDAGADIIIADSFAATAPVLAHKGTAGKSAECARAAVPRARRPGGGDGYIARRGGHGRHGRMRSPGGGAFVRRGLRLVLYAGVRGA